MSHSRSLVVMGASLGGFDAIATVLSHLDKGFPAAIAIVQHRAADPSSRLAELLSRHSELPVVEPEDREAPEPGKVYLAPSDYHLLIEKTEFRFSIDPPEHFARPSIDALFETAAEADFDSLIGVLLTASSEDGARGLEKLSRSGGIAIVQDPEEAQSSTAIRAALARHCVDYTRPIAAIAPLLQFLVVPSFSPRSAHPPRST